MVTEADEGTGPSQQPPIGSGKECAAEADGGTGPGRRRLTGSDKESAVSPAEEAGKRPGPTHRVLVGRGEGLAADTDETAVARTILHDFLLERGYYLKTTNNEA